jgi:predicted GNAT family acetyltransferase
MDEVKLNLNEKHRGAFYLQDGEQRLGEMEIGINGEYLTVYHTEVIPEMEGRGWRRRCWTRWWPMPGKTS